MHIARTQFNLKTYVYGRTTKTPFPPSLTFYHSFAASVLSNTHSNILPISTSAWPSRAWSFRANARIPAMNVFEPDSPVEAGTVPVNMVKAVDADGILEGMLYGDWPMNVWKVAAGRMVEGKKSKSWRWRLGLASFLQPSLLVSLRSCQCETRNSWFRFSFSPSRR
ncbi:hypothetical protein BC829DRAFT_265334 [Chytridium lagenaria]|nr:hypothetical protein BC829DRAFT_265334 [Chytridium lagenaria]